MERTALHSRLETAAGDRTYRHLAELTATHPETVRRYMQGHAPSVEFLTGFCSTLGVSAAWLLTGQGPMLAAEVKGHVLKAAAPTDLLGAMAEQLEAMRSRLERVEVYVQTLETRVRAAAAGGAGTGPGAHGSAPGEIAAGVEAKPPAASGDPSLGFDNNHGPGHAAAGGGTVDDGQEAAHPAADRIADAVAKRPPEAAG